MKRLWLIALVFAILFPELLQADVPEYSVLKTTEKIVIDGILDEKDWETAKPAGNFVFPWLRKGEKEQTEVKMLWDDTFLYVSFKCQDKHIWAEHFDTNSDTCLDDCVEIFWDPNPEDPRRKYNMFEMNCVGNVLSVYVGSGESIKQRVSRIMVPHIAQSIQGTLNNDEDIDTGWLLEIAIRFSDYPELSKLTAPVHRDYWRVGLNRCGGKTNDQYSQWSPTQSDNPNFHAPKDFGKIIFNDKPVR